MPLAQLLPLAHCCVTQVVQPMAASIWQVCRSPVPLQIEAPVAQTSLQQVAVLTAMVFKVEVSCAWLEAT